MNPARQTYDYQSGRGLDGFLSAAIDEVSWETNLGSTVNTLSQSAIGSASPYANTAINYDASQISGSQGDATSLGGSGGGAAGTGGAGNLQIDSGNGNISLSDGTTTRLKLGLQDSGTYSLRVAPPGRDVSSDFLIFNSEQIVGFRTCPATDVVNGSEADFRFTVPHNLGYVPNFTVLATVINPSAAVLPATTQFPASFYAPISGEIQFQQASSILNYVYFAGIDSQNLYMSLAVVNNSGGTLTSIPVTFLYYIQQVRIV